ncbi:RHS repeat-associated core domain-containing protein [Fluviispira multicolorata]|uniref:Tox-REase-7 domain-containing protein n=1 Tax=Fluviispira multicolorata TaxID=2654512 RepID=A0A833N5E0_9BACT|nr:RHS repeat-associated core domain-containing protein [Fluviispira multicolorata]KAB8027416.1 hypothetical protein GCL57_14565 [Fluviispira multicolorata]
MQKFASDSIGFRKYGVAPTLAVLNSDTLNRAASSWKNQEEIPMHKYIWNGRGQLAGVFGAVLKKDSHNLEANELLNYRMSDAGGGQLAEFDGVDYLENKKDKTTEVTLTKLPRNVNLTDGISFERDEIHLSIDLGSFATLRLITRYPTLNATSPETLKSAEMQTRKELIVKDHVGSVSQVIDISTHKIVERNASEPFGLARGIPLLSNSVLNEFKTNNKRADIVLYQNAQSNMRDNWELKSYEVVGSSNGNAAQGMRGSTVFATGKFSASTGLHNMGARAYDPARGVWMSPDLYLGQSLERMFSSPVEANLFQYSMNNPVLLNDPSGKFVPALVIGAVWGYRAFQAYRTVQAIQAVTMVSTAVIGGKILADASVSNNEVATNPNEASKIKSIATLNKAETCNVNSNKQNADRKLAENRSKGARAEAMVARETGLIKNTKRYEVPGFKNGSTIPDFIDRSNKYGVIEVKNVNEQVFRSQIEMQLEVAKELGLRYTLFVDKRAKLSSKLVQEIYDYNEINGYGIKEGIERRDFNEKDKTNGCEIDLNEKKDTDTHTKNDKDLNAEKSNKFIENSIYL